MRKGFVSVISLVFAVCCCTPAWSASQKKVQPPKTEEFDLSSERVGGLRLGQPASEVEGIIACKPQKGKEQFMGATGEYVQTWKYPDCGLELDMSSERKGGRKTVASITLTSSGKLATGKGIHIGSTEAEVLSLYGKYKDKDGVTQKGKKFVAGSVFGGMIFTFKEGKVSGIFLGAAAE